MTSRTKHILITDDSATMRRMVRACLRDVPDVLIDEAASGLEALERLTLAPVDLLILDLNMPDIHGLEVLQFVRGHQTYQDMPVIVLTTRSDEDSRRAAEAAGVSLYLTKPFDPQALAAGVRALIGPG